MAGDTVSFTLEVKSSVLDGRAQGPGTVRFTPLRKDPPATARPTLDLPDLGPGPYRYVPPEEP